MEEEKIIKVEDLILDESNPRFAEFYSGNEQSDIVEYLLNEEDATDIAKSIIEFDGFRKDKKLLVIKRADKYIVKDGNRRCAAVKAINNKDKYPSLKSSMIINELPVIVYTDEAKLAKIIKQEHTSQQVKSWSPIAKALLIHKLYKTSSEEELKNIDSNVSRFMKIANFYFAAVELCGDHFKELVKNNKKLGGKLIIFERLWGVREKCGYKFKDKRRDYAVDIKNKDLFSSYIKAVTDYLYTYPETTYYQVNKINDQNIFLKELVQYGFNPDNIHKKQEDIDSDLKDNFSIKRVEFPISPGVRIKISGAGDNNGSDNMEKDSNSKTPNGTRGSVKRRPSYKRKKINPKLASIINECYSLKKDDYPNAKLAMTRIVFECTLKYVIENTKYNGKTLMSKSNHFYAVYRTKKGEKKKYTDFEEMRNKFILLINDTGIENAFKDFDINKTHQTIHNYRVSATNIDSNCNNLIEIVEFLLQEEQDLLDSLDLNKL
jgi:hypothetical protein